MSVNLRYQSPVVLQRAIALIASPIYDAHVYVDVRSPYVPSVTYVTEVDGNTGRLITQREGGSALMRGGPDDHARYVLDKIAARQGSISRIGFSNYLQSVVLWEEQT